jgi:hypothetical protein
MILADGVLKTMLLKKLTVAGCLFASLGIGIGTGALVIRRSQAQDAPAAATPANRPTARPDQAKAKAVDPLVQRLLDAARERLEAQRTYYEKGRITLDRFLDACTQLERAELLAAADEGERMAAREKYLDILTQVLRHEQAELQVGRGTQADVAEAQHRREVAEMELRTARNDFDEYDAKARKLLDYARGRYEAQEAYYKEGRITLDRLADASLQLAEAERRTARTDFERIAARRRHLDRSRAIEAREETEMKEGRGAKADLAEATTRRIEAELALHEADNSKGSADLTPILRRLGELERKVEQLQKERGGQGRP